MPDVTATNKMEAKMVTLAREIAKDIIPLDQILKSHQISVNDYQIISTNPYFQSILAQAAADWNSASNTVQRVRLKAAAIVEEGLLEMSARLHDTEENLNAKVELFKVLTKLGNLEVQKEASGGNERFSLVINIGDNNPKTISATVTPVVRDVEDEWGVPVTYEDADAN